MAVGRFNGCVFFKDGIHFTRDGKVTQTLLGYILTKRVEKAESGLPKRNYIVFKHVRVARNTTLGMFLMW